MLKNNYFLAGCSALLLWLGWPPIPFSGPVLLVALVPLLLAVERIRQRERRAKGRAVFLLALSCFVVWNTASIYWVFNSLYAVMPLVPAIFIALIPYGLAATLMALAFWLFFQLSRFYPRGLSYAGWICFWLGYEYLHQTWDLAFPWMTLGNGFASSTPLVQWYSITGVYGGTVWILLANILVFEWIRAVHLEPAKKTRLLIAAASVLLVPMLFSLVQYSGYEEKSDPANIVVVQPNIDPFQRFDNFQKGEQLRQLERLSDSVGQKNTEYFLWPETAIASFTDEDSIRTNPYYLDAQRFLSKYKNGNLLSGIESYRLYATPKTATARYADQIGQYADSFNAAVLIENSAKVQFYHKSKLVPGVEMTPFSTLSFLKPLLASFGGSTGGYGHQDAPSVFYSRSGIGAGPVICYESIWGEWVAKSVKNGAQFIAIVTNDGWWGNTSGKDQHFDYARLRAIETRRWVARSANTGISGFINQRGDVVKRSGWWTATALKADINLNEELTFYVQYGDYLAFAGCCGAALFGILLLWAWARARLFPGRPNDAPAQHS